MGTILGRLHETALAGAADAELLRRFSTGGGSEGEAAFAVLVRRHGPLVLRICQSTLLDRHDAEDAFQAAFLVLATKARALPARTAVGPWLGEVARRVSAHARAAAVRRRVHEMKAAARRPEACPADPPGPDLAAAVLEAVGRLPERYRLPIMLCDLEGLTYQEAGRQLSISHAAVRNRLARGRARLRSALGRLGVATVGEVLLPMATPAVPRALAAATSCAAVLVAAGTADGVVPSSVLILMTGGLIMSKVKSLSLSTVAAGVLIAGAVGLSAQPPNQNQDQDPARNSAATFAATLKEYYQHAATQGSTSTTIDPSDRMAKLLQEAKEKQAAGDAAGALKALRQLDDTSWAWQGSLRQQRAVRPPSRDPLTGRGLYSDAGVSGSTLQTRPRNVPLSTSTNSASGTALTPPTAGT